MKSYFSKSLLIGSIEILCRLPLVFTAGYLANNLGPEIYGNWALILMMQAFVTGIASMGLPPALYRLASVCGYSKSRGYLIFALKSELLVYSLLFIVVLSFLSFVSTLFGVASEYSMLVIPGLFITVGNLVEFTLDSYFKARTKISRNSVLIFTRAMAEVVSILTVFKLQPSLFAGDAVMLITAYAFIGFIVKTIMYSILFFVGEDNPEVINKSEKNEIFRFGLPIILTSVLSWLFSQGDRFILGHLASKNDLGIYNFGASLASQMAILSFIVYPLLLPQMSRFFDQGNYEEIAKLVQKSQYMFLFMAVYTIVLINLFSVEIILLTAGSAFINSANILIVLSISCLVDQLFLVYGYFFNVVKKNTYLIFCLLIKIAFVLFGTFIAISFWDIYMVPWATLTGSVMANIIQYRLAQRELVIPMTRKMMGVIFICALIVLAVAKGVSDWGLTARIGFVVCFTSAGVALFFAKIKAFRG